MTPYVQGFLTKCAEYGVDGEALLKAALSAETAIDATDKAVGVGSLLADNALRDNVNKTLTGLGKATRVGHVPGWVSKVLGPVGSAIGGWGIGRTLGDGVTYNGRSMDEWIQHGMGAPLAQGNGQRGLHFRNTDAKNDMALGLAGAGTGLAAASSVAPVAMGGSVAGAGLLGWGLGRFMGKHLRWGGKSLDEHVQRGFERLMAPSTPSRQFANTARQPTRMVMR